MRAREELRRGGPGGGGGGQSFSVGTLEHDGHEHVSFIIERIFCKFVTHRGRSRPKT